MHQTIATIDRTRAKAPHELMMVNLFGFHLLMTPLILFSGIGTWGLVLPPLLSGAVITYIYWRGKQAERRDPWFVMAHWKLALAQGRWLVLSYGVSGGLLLLAWLLSLGAGKTQDIMFTVLTRVAVMPTVIAVFVTAVLASSGIYQATRGEVPARLAERFPPPAPPFS